MIGVISNICQRPAVEEFFQLFKVPWEYYEKDRAYDVVITNGNTVVVPPARLLIIFSPEPTSFDKEDSIDVVQNTGGILLEHSHLQFPIYRDLATFHSSKHPFIKIRDGKGEAGFISVYEGQRILRIGYDLFNEIAFVLSQGQAIEYAHIPTVDIHISLLRNWIIEAGIPLCEIPPFPAGYSFVTCLTHDVDFIDIRSHKFDRSVIGFIIRAILPFHIRDYRSKIVWSKLLRNWKALLSLPGVYTGLSRDVWFDIDRYMELERDMNSTYFFIPFKNDPGNGDKNKISRQRAARYDIDDYKDIIEDLIKKGHEIALHGIDAWHDPQKGYRELQVIRRLARTEEIGVRMHWLYFSQDSVKALEKAGFLYDSTLGYNETVGYRTGTTQIFLLPGASKVFELPLNVMDTAMFSRGRMNMCEADSFQMCRRLIGNMKTYGGVFTVNWHTRSLSPERNWDDFYVELLEMLKSQNVWFATAKQAINWFHKRRSIHFDDVRYYRDKIWLKLRGDCDNSLPDILLRVHRPGMNSKQSFIDTPWAGKAEITFTL